MKKVGEKPIEDTLPLDAMGKTAVRQGSLRHGHRPPWWERQPLAAAGAVIFAQADGSRPSHREPDFGVTRGDAANGAEGFDEEPIPDLDSEAIDFGAASECFAERRPLRRKDLETLGLVRRLPAPELPELGFRFRVSGPRDPRRRWFVTGKEGQT